MSLVRTVQLLLLSLTILFPKLSIFRIKPRFFESPRTVLDFISLHFHSSHRPYRILLRPFPKLIGLDSLRRLRSLLAVRALLRPLNDSSNSCSDAGKHYKHAEYEPANDC